MCVNNPDRLPLKVQGRAPAQAPSGFLEVVGDDLPVFIRPVQRRVPVCVLKKTFPSRL